MSEPRGKELLQRLEREVVVADGAFGTMLYARGVPLGTCYDQLNSSDPDLVRSIHRAYIAAGAELIETNTFGANASLLRPFGLDGQVREINEAGARLARAAADTEGPAGGGRRVYVAGSVGPLGRRAGEDMPEDAELIFKEAILALAEGGADLLILVTFLDVAELAAALRVAKEFAPSLPVVAELAFMEKGRTARGAEAVVACRATARLGADVFGTNCGKGPREIVDAIEKTVRAGCEAKLLSAMPNAGYPELVNGRYIYLTTPGYMADQARRLADAGVTLVGGCCGTTPPDIAAIAAAVRGRRRVPFAEAQERLAAAAAAAGVAPAEAKEKARARMGPPEVAFSVVPPLPSEGRDLDFLRTPRRGPGERPFVLVEIDPPKDLDVERCLKGARALAHEGVDAVTVGDNPLAIMRMSHLAFGYLVQREAKVRAICHLSCRDRNLIGIQSELMGAHALGIRTILGITGDPASIGNQPGATSVYDMNSFGLVELMAKMNRGENLLGEPIARRTAFVIGVAMNPNGRKMDDQLRRLAKKRELGAHYVMTQPCYGPARIREMVERAAPLGMPIFLGVLPVTSHRSAEYLHNEVPGIEVPEPVRRRLIGLDKEAGKREGLAIAREIIEEVFDIVHGFYIIPPFNNYKNGLELLQFIRERSRGRSPTDGKRAPGVTA